MDAQPPDAAGEVVLGEAARQRLVQVAAEVLGRMDAEEVPASLRAVARFTPAKRARLGAVAIAAALDVDEGFRERVAAVVAQSSPGLVQAMQSGADLQASDPVDTAVVAYLLRPPGWSATMAQANARYHAERAPQEAAEQESARLRSELTELRAQVRAEQQRLTEQRMAAQGAGDEATQPQAEVDRLRRELRLRTGALRSAERERDVARADAARAVQEASAAVARLSDGESELNRMRARAAELERAAARTSRRQARRERELDETRLRLLLDTLGDAAAGLRRELDLAPAPVRPGDVVAEELWAEIETRPAGEEVVPLERLLELPQVHLIVDGYNVTKTGYGDLTLAEQRNRLIGALATLAARLPVEITLAFDGAARPPVQPRAPRGVRVLFSAAHEIADDLIRRLVAAEPPGRPVVVVTADQAVVTDVRAAGARTVPSAALLAYLG